MVYWITGKAGAGKSHYAYNLARELRSKNVPVVVLDGDDVRKYFPAGYDNISRYEHIIHIAKIAALLEKQDVVVICALISPYRRWRDEARSMFEKSILVYVPGGSLWEGSEYEEPSVEEIVG